MQGGQCDEIQGSVINHPSINQSITHQSINQSINQYLRMFLDRVIRGRELVIGPPLIRRKGSCRKHRASARRRCEARSASDDEYEECVKRSTDGWLYGARSMETLSQEKSAFLCWNARHMLAIQGEKG